MRVGTGYDSHRFYEGRKFMLDGVEIGFDKGLWATAARTLLHTIIDSMFSAAGLSDISAISRHLRVRGQQHEAACRLP